MGLKSSAAGNQPLPDINVTPLVDVVLVLLIIFMVITPALVDGEQIELPAIVQADPKPRDLHPIEVTIAPNGIVVLEDEHIDPNSLRSKVEVLHSQDPKRALLLKSDGKMPYKRVRETFAMLQGIGFKGVALKVTEKKQSGKGPS
jgi:biopolymer transport protein ExbD/biopolymer transport protein TolR